MNFLKRLFGISDPTADWPAPAGTAPSFDLRTLAIGPLRFNSPFAEARVLGKPDAFKGNAEKSSTLFYGRAGHSLDYEEGRLVFVTYYAGPYESPTLPGPLIQSPISIVLPDGTVHVLNQDSDAEALVAAFGKPESAEIDEDESILTWERADLTIEAELNERSRLVLLNVFLTN
jgi:hypothetical protein